MAEYNPIVSACWIAKKLYEGVRAFLSMLVKSIAKLLMIRHGVVREPTGCEES